MIILERTGAGDLETRLIAALATRGVAVPITDRDDVHIQSAVAATWRRISEAASDVDESLADVRTRFQTDGTFHPRVLQLAMQRFVYEAAETFELYGKRLGFRLSVDRSRPELARVNKYLETVRRLGGPTAIMCNHMKHKNRELDSGIFVSERTGELALVYRVTAQYASGQNSDRLVHKDGPVTSYWKSLHEILHRLLRVDHAAGELIGGLSENGSIAVASASSPLGLVGVIDRLAAVPAALASSESTRFDGLEIGQETVSLVRIEGQRVPEPTRRTMNSVVDPVSLSIQLMI